MGISNDIIRRTNEHTGKYGDIRDISKVDVHRNQARALEQMGIEDGNFLDLGNSINSISPNHRFYNPAMEWAIKNKDKYLK